MPNNPTTVEQGAARAFVDQTPLPIGPLINLEVQATDVNGKLAVIRHAYNQIIPRIRGLIRDATLPAYLDFPLPRFRTISNIRIGQLKKHWNMVQCLLAGKTRGLGNNRGILIDFRIIGSRHPLAQFFGEFKHRIKALRRALLKTFKNYLV
jgi:hypothetical protein